MRSFSIYTGTSGIPRSEKGVANGVATLDGAGKIPASQIPFEFVSFKGNWNASTNTPTLADGAGTLGDTYKTSVAGTTDFGSGPISFEIGDYAFNNGTTIEKVDHTDADHNDLVGLQGGTTAQYFHLTSAEHSALIGISDGSVLFGASGLVSESSDLFWDNALSRLGIGTNTPSEALDVAGTIKSGVSGTDGISSWNNASDIETAKVNTNGASFFNGGNVGIGTSTPDRLFHIEEETALTDTVNYNLRLTHTTSSGSPVAGIGVGQEYEVESSDGNLEILGTFECIATDVTPTSENGAFVWKLMSGGSAASEVGRLTDVGNFGLKTSTFGSGAVGVLGIANGTQGAAAADMIQIVSADLTATNTTISVRTEGTGSSGTGTGDNTSDGFITWIWNGTTHYLLTKSTQPV